MSKQTFLDYLQKVFEGKTVRIIEYFKTDAAIDLVLFEANNRKYWYNCGKIIAQQ